MESRIERPGLPASARCAYRVALACGALPLVAGTSIFLLWLVFRWEWLVNAGGVTIGIGSFLFVLGTIVLTGFSVQTRRCPELPRRRVRRMTIGAALLLLANFPVAGGIVAASLAVVSCYTVVVENHSPSSLEAVSISGGGCKVDFGHLSPGGSRRRWFWVRHDGQLILRAASVDTIIKRTVDGYVTNGLGAYRKITIEPGAVISVADASGQSSLAW